MEKNECKNNLENIVKKYSDTIIFEFYSSNIICFIYYKKEKCVIYFNKNGEMIYKGQFNIKKKMFDGYGFLYLDDEIYKGNFKNNKKHGKGILKIKKSQIEFHAIWNHDKIINIEKEQYLKI